MLDSDPVLSDPASLEPRGTDSARTILSKQSDHVRNRWNSDPHEQKSLNSENVLLVLQNVMKTKSSFFRRLFSEREHATAERFLSLPNQSQTLVALLMNRRRTWFNSRAHFRDYCVHECDLKLAVRKLVEAGFFETE
jgi:hypothetical protein